MLVQARTGAKISVGVEFFNKWSLPFTALLMLAMGFCLLYSKINKDKLTRMAAGVIIATAVSIIVKPTANLYINSLGPLALFGGMGAIYRIVHGISSPKTLKGKLRQASIYLIHLGLALILIGTLISAVYEAEMSTSFTFPDEKGIKRSILMGYAIAVNDIEVYLTQDGWWATAIELGVYKDDKYIGGGLAESIDDRKFGKVTHVYINRGLFSDVYVIFQGLATQRPGSVIVPLTVKIIPGVGILWLGIVLLSVGILPLIIIETRLEIPPVRYSRMIAEDSAGQVSNPDREYLEKSLAELRKSYEEGKISKKAYKTLKKQYEKALEES
jgi:cytochrome c biogenesis factor